MRHAGLRDPFNSISTNRALAAVHHELLKLKNRRAHPSKNLKTEGRTLLETSKQKGVPLLIVIFINITLSKPLIRSMEMFLSSLIS